MRRSQTAFLIFTLFTAPLNLLAGANGCGRQMDCCHKMCCNSHSGHSAGRDETCNRTHGRTRDCALKSSCQHPINADLSAPLPLAVSPAPVYLLSPGMALHPRLVLYADLLAAVISPPLQPPRA